MNCFFNFFIKIKILFFCNKFFVHLSTLGFSVQELVRYQTLVQRSHGLKPIMRCLPRICTFQDHSLYSCILAFHSIRTIYIYIYRHIYSRFMRYYIQCNSSTHILYIRIFSPDTLQAHVNTADSATKFRKYHTTGNEILA